MLLKTFHPEIRMLLDMNEFIHDSPEKEYAEYHRTHIDLVNQYSLILNKRLGFKLSEFKLTYNAYAHDLLKEHGLDELRQRKYKSHTIPENVTLYVRNNLDILEQYGMDEYFNSAAQYHALAAAIFLVKELKITDPEIIYPVMFHSCPVINVYEALPVKTQQYVDIMMLADKLSSNYLRINWRETPVAVDLDLAVFGENGNELHYALGLYLARAIGDKTDAVGVQAMSYYTERLSRNMPWINIKKIALGGAKKWPKRKSPLTKTVY